MFRKEDQMHLRYLSLGLAAIFAAVSPVSAVVIVNETFDNYTSEAELHANWRGNPGAGTVAGTIEQVEEKFVLEDAIVHSADFDGDGNVDARDFIIWRNNLNATGATLQIGDANRDGVVNRHDYRLWKGSYGTEPPSGPPGKAIKHVANTSPPSTPDGNIVWTKPLDPNFFDGSIFPTAAEPIVMRGDIYVASGATQRNTIGLRYDNPAANLVELGFYNGNMKGAGLRVALWQTSGGGTNPDWQYFDFDPVFDIDDRFPTLTGGGAGNVTWSEIFQHFGAAWHQFEITITETSVLATIDLLRDGINNATGEAGVDATLSFDTGITLQQAGFNSLRIGGPSQLGTEADAWFDNIFLSGPQETVDVTLLTATVPEPTTWALGLIAGVTCLAARRCRLI